MKKRLIITIVLLIVSAMLGAIVYGYCLLDKIEKKEIPKTNEELLITEQPKKNEIEKNIDDKKKEEPIINIALFGLDRRYRDVSSRSDTIMVVSIDSNNQKIKVTSLMRDMYVPIPGHKENRINAAYVYGGPVLAIKTINSNFGLDVRNYVSIDFFGFEKLIDKIGGIEIKVSAEEAKVMNFYIKELNRLNGDTVENVNGGAQVLNGRQAVAYSRVRYVGNADYERTERQRKVLNEVFKKVKKSSITELPGIISTILPYVETSFSKGKIINLAVKVVGFNTENIEQFRLPVDGFFKSQRIRGMDVLVPDMEGNRKKMHEFIYE